MAPRRKPASDRLSRLDGWASLITGLGTDRDRRTSLSFTASLLSYEQLTHMYRGDDMAARIVELLPGEMLRRGFTVSIKDDKDASEAVQNRLDELNVVARVERALCLARAFGGAGILLGANDGALDLAQPLDLDAVRSLDWLTVLDCRELQPAAYYTDPAHPRYGEPSVYEITPSVTTDPKAQNRRVHETRILRFDGVVVTRRQIQENNGWGDSVLQRVHEVLRDFAGGWGGAAHLLTDFAQGELKIPGLLELLSTKKGQETLLTRLRAMELMRSTVRAMVTDAGDETGHGAESFERKTTPLSGLAELLDKFALRVAAAARTPVSLLMGQAPAGLNATGDSDIRWFYDHVAASQVKELRPQLNRLVRILLRAKTGPTKSTEPESWKVVFPPLWEMTDLEKAELRNKQAQTDVAYIQAGVLDPSEVAVSRFGGEEYSTDTHLDLATRKAMETAGPAEEKPEGESEPAP
jgi:phage-related protein (TIGR01555 family)